MIEDKEHKQSSLLPIVVALVVVVAVAAIVKTTSERLIVDPDTPRKEVTAESFTPEPTRLERAVAAEVERIRQAGEPMPSPEDIVMRAIAGVTAEEEQSGSN